MFSSLPREVDTDCLTSGPLTPQLPLREQRVKEGAAWRGGKAICPVCGMLAAITSNCGMSVV